MVLLSNESISDIQRTTINNNLYIIDDIERVGDHVENIVELAQYKDQHGLSFSEEATDGLNAIFEKCEEVFTKTMKSVETEEKEIDDNIDLKEDEIDEIERKSRQDHMDRLSRMECMTEPGVLYLDTIANLERISDHSVNIAMYVLDKFK